MEVKLRRHHIYNKIKLLKISKSHYVIINDAEKNSMRKLNNRLRQILTQHNIYRSSTNLLLNDFVTAIPYSNKKSLIKDRRKTQFNTNNPICLFSETSGTTGDEPLQTPRSNTELAWNSKNISHAFSRHLTLKQDRVALIHPGIMSPFIEACTKSLTSSGIPYLKIFPIQNICTYQRISEVINRYNITTIMSTPSLVAKLLYEFDTLEIKIPTSINKILLTGEYISNSMKKNFDGLLNIHGASREFVYGSSEAATCMYGDNNLLWGFHNDFLFELINCKKSNLSTDLISGELVVTWLNDGVHPLVRYCTKDLFEYDSNSNGFKSLGRINLNCNVIQNYHNIHKILYSMSEPIYNFQIVEFKNHINIYIFISRKILSNIISIRKHIRIKCEKILGKQCNIFFNSTSHEFSNFSPKPKYEQFKSNE